MCALSLWVVGWVMGCGGRSVQGTTGSGAAGIGAGVAAAIWAVGGGCKLQGCPYGSWCNKKTGFCITTKCSAGCPEGTVCNEGLNRCQNPPPAAPPSDFLPDDQHPIGTPYQ